MSVRYPNPICVNTDTDNDDDDDDDDDDEAVYSLLEPVSYIS